MQREAPARGRGYRAAWLACSSEGDWWGIWGTQADDATNLPRTTSSREEADISYDFSREKIPALPPFCLAYDGRHSHTCLAYDGRHALKSLALMDDTHLQSLAVMDDTLAHSSR